MNCNNSCKVVFSYEMINNSNIIIFDLHVQYEVYYRDQQQEDNYELDTLVSK